jgi:alpha-L-arabinofuranosidase
MRRLLVVAATGLLLTGTQPPVEPAGTITVDASRLGPAIPRNLYGIFFEEINHAGDGGLYAELVRNRGFEDARLPPTCTLEDGFVVPPRTPHFDSGKPNDFRLRWNVTSETPGWRLDVPDGSARMRLVDEEPLTAATPHSLQVDISRAPASGRVAVINDGFWGTHVEGGARYRLSLYARGDGSFAGPITARLETGTGATLASAQVAMSPGRGWTRYETVLTATGSDPEARLALEMGGTGRVWLDFVSLFPERTWKGRPNGLRPDLADLIAALKPGFVRWPGGCFVEGITIGSRHQWKKTIGRLEDREGTYSPWGYWSSDGFGYYEFLQFAEDVGADALLVVNAGVSCSMRSGTYLEDDELPGLIQDALDAIEYATGPVASKWGALRAAHGHPAPFPLKYIEIGNEQRGERYGRRVRMFYDAIKAKHPDMQVALSSWIAGVDQRIIDAAGRIDIVDEHAYKPLHWAVENFDTFAGYRRQGWDLYIGEFATNAGVGRGNLLAMLNDAAYMMSMEKNTDLVKMGSYAPLLENVNARHWPVNLIHFDSSRAYARASYYAARLFAEHLPTVNLPADVIYRSASDRPITARPGVATHNTAAEFRDVVVERAGRVLYRSDFASRATDWTPEGRGGQWSVEDGVYRQSQPAVAWSFIPAIGGGDFTISLRARKLSGLEGFIIPVGEADGRRVQWNIGGWGNRLHAVQAAGAVVGEQTPGSIETGRWYDIRIEVHGRTVRGFLDGVLLQERMLPRVDRVLAIAGRDEPSGDLIVKVVNTSPDAAPMMVNLRGVTTASQVVVHVLTSANPQDENTFEAPARITPRAATRALDGPSFVHSFPPYSLTILRIPAR